MQNKEAEATLTKTRILNAAEELFANQAVEGVSLRTITGKASVNLAAVNYYFGNKESLYRELLTVRIRALNERRFAKLQAATALAGGGPLSLEEVIGIMARPLFDLHRSTEPGGRAFVKILARSITEPDETTSQILGEEYHPIIARFGQLIRRDVPQLAPVEFLWRLSFVVGALHHTLATLHQMSQLTRGICRSDDYEGAFNRFVDHAVRTFRAPTLQSNDASR